MTIQVKRVRRNKIVGVKTPSQNYYLTPEPGSFRTLTDEDLAYSIEKSGGRNADDLTHMLRTFIRKMKSSLRQGDKVKIKGLGTFYVTFNCTAAPKEEECTVRNIRKVNVRFKVDNDFRLVNESIISGCSDNSIKFKLKK